MVVADLDDRVTYVNAACERMTGWPRQEVLGKRTTVFFGGTEEAARVQSVVRAGGAWRGEVECARRNGERFYADLAAFPVLNAAGAATASISILRDISARHRLLVELEASEARYRQLFDAASDMIFVADATGVLLRVNAATTAAFGCSAEELVDRSLRELVCKKQQAAIEGVLGRLSAGERSVQIDLTFEVGERRREVEALFSLRGPAEHPEGLLAICRDVTERRRLQESAQAAARLRDLGRFASTVAHEIRNPLSSVKLAVQALARTAAPLDDKDRRRLHIAAREIGTMERVLHEILDFVGSGHPALEPGDVSEVVKEALEGIEAEARDRGVTFDLRSEHTPLVWLDAGRAKRAIVNVCLNAMQAMPHGGVVDVEILPSPEGGADVQVLDRGPGVPDERKASVFEPFVTYRARGTGLGLAVVKKVMDEHGGAVTVADREGGGAVFTLRFAGARARP